MSVLYVYAYRKTYQYEQEQLTKENTISSAMERIYDITMSYMGESAREEMCT